MALCVKECVKFHKIPFNGFRGIVDWKSPPPPLLDNLYQIPCCALENPKSHLGGKTK